ncbi:MAG: radical SAM protein [Pseudomonadota bacterium]
MPSEKNGPLSKGQVDDQVFQSLVAKLEMFAETINPAERQLVRLLIDRTVDPIERVRRQEGDRLFDESEVTFLEKLCSEQPPDSAERAANDSKSIDLIVKVTRRCNLRCTYCGEWRASPGHTMEFPILARTIVRALREYDNVTFIWHGGETTLLPISFYKKAMLIQARFRRSGQHIANGLQTNGTLLDDEWGRFLRDARFGVGISLDGPPEIQNRTRPFAGGKPSYDAVVRGIEVLRRHGLNASALLVVDREVLSLGPECIFDFFIDLGISRYSCLAAKPVRQQQSPAETSGVHYTNTERYTEFLRGLYDRWLAHGDRSIRIRELDAIRARILGKDAAICTIAGNCFGRFFTIEPNGDVKPCDCYGEAQGVFGSISDMSFSDIMRSSGLRRLIDENEAALQSLRDRCSEFEITRGGCPYDRFVAAKFGQTHCCTYHGLVDHIRDRLPVAQSMPNQDECVA